MLITYEVRATYLRAKNLKGIRASVFQQAELHQAAYSLDRSKSIWYDEGSNNLEINLLFESKSSAIIFREFLVQWYLNNPVVKSCDASVEEIS